MTLLFQLLWIFYKNIWLLRDRIHSYFTKKDKKNIFWSMKGSQIFFLIATLYDVEYYLFLSSYVSYSLVKSLLSYLLSYFWMFGFPTYRLVFTRLVFSHRLVFLSLSLFFSNYSLYIYLIPQNASKPGFSQFSSAMV